MVSQGSHRPGFEPVAAEFERNFSERGDVGAAVAVYLDGEPVVELWGGEARTGEPWRGDTMASVFSTTKGPTALVAQLLADHGVIDVTRRVCAYWPEFASAGKADITVEQVMCHTSGVITFPDYMDVLDLEDHWAAADVIADRLAAADPVWPPGSRHGYHALTFGWILGEVVRRADGRTLGTVFREEIAQPLGIDFHIGLAAEEHHRVADLVDAPPPDDPMVAMYLAAFNPESWTGQAHFVGPHGILGVADAFNSAPYRSAEIPAGGGIGTAGGLARMYGMLAAGGVLDGQRIVSAASIDEFTRERVRGLDAVLMFETRFALGYARPTAVNYYGPNDAAFGHGGLGGSVAFGDPVAGIGFAYVPRQLMFPRLDETTRATALIDAVYRCL